MDVLLKRLLQLSELREMTDQINAGHGPALLTGLGPVHRAQAAAAAAHATGRPLLMLCADERECQRMAADLHILLDCEAVILPAREIQLHTTAAASRQWEYRRLDALHRLTQGGCPVVVTTPDALAQRSIPPQILQQSVLTLGVGGQ